MELLEQLVQRAVRGAAERHEQHPDVMALRQQQHALVHSATIQFAHYFGTECAALMSFACDDALTLRTTVVYQHTTVCIAELDSGEWQVWQRAYPRYPEHVYARNPIQAFNVGRIDLQLRIQTDNRDELLVAIYAAAMR